MALNQGPKITTAQAAYAAFEKCYPLVIQQKFDSIFRIQDQVERANYIASLSAAERQHFKDYKDAIIELERIFHRTLILETPTYTPLLTQAQQRNDNHAVVAKAPQRQEQVDDKKIKSNTKMLLK